MTQAIHSFNRPEVIGNLVFVSGEIWAAFPYDFVDFDLSPYMREIIDVSLGNQMSNYHKITANADGGAAVVGRGFTNAGTHKIIYDSTKFKLKFMNGTGTADSVTRYSSSTTEGDGRADFYVPFLVIGRK